MAGFQAGKESPFSFELIGENHESFKGLHARETQENLLRWGLNESLKLTKIRYGGRFHESTERRFVSELLASRASGLVGVVVGGPGGAAAAVHSYTDGILRPPHRGGCRLGLHNKGGGGGMADEEFAGKVVSDCLREMLANPDSEKAGLFKEEDRDELIFHLFKLLCLGGAISQPDDQVSPYLDTTKLLYKDAVSVYRCAKTREIKAGARAYVVDSTASGLFPNPGSPHNFCLVVVNPLLRQATIIYQPFLSFW
eukprot:CAMPEP_0194666812 /NCGR_PEP_ID=MMETSP0295-20121207/2957_1 /TAXON_ID=39354 /ORGANISM="Heterosigma akashiwo, Strain CCMP2393" /LENGTH=253 /DNA_ID=CAMNT_0039549171 /DNA_START=69 /DNA_END=831 /DNA_ORIENTATION=-